MFSSFCNDDTFSHKNANGNDAPQNDWKEGSENTVQRQSFATVIWTDLWRRLIFAHDLFQDPTFP